MIDNKNKLPGYTGHIPYKNGSVGMTTGEANRQCMAQYN